jgi:hypothetical protein
MLAQHQLWAPNLWLECESHKMEYFIGANETANSQLIG